jgi:large subunit ribosomal protein L7/L12
MDPEEMAARIEELERRLNWLYQATGFGAPYPGNPGTPEFGAAGPGGTGLSAAVLDLVRRDKKIAAIKQYRQETGVGLAEAKAVIDRVL